MPIEPTSIRSSKPNVLLIGAPLLDLVFLVSEHFVHSLSGKKGGMEIIDESQFQEILFRVGIPESQTLGGSAANVAKVLANLNTSCAFSGTLGNDKAGKHFQRTLQEFGISSYCSFSDQATGQVFCFVTPDTLRTCRSYLGASEEYDLAHIKPIYFQGKQHLHLEGYTLLKPSITEFAIQQAKEQGLTVSFDLGSFEIVEANQSRLDMLLPNIDILFGNEQEARALTNKNCETSCQILKEKVQIAIIFQGDKGCMVGAKGQEIFHVPALKVKAIDTTGAGDFFAGSFLHNFLNGKPLLQCAQEGAACAAEVVQVFGTDLPKETWQKILTKNW